MSSGLRARGRPPVDTELLHAVRQGDIQPFRYLYRRHGAAAYAYALTCVSSPSDAYDLSSYAFSQLLQKLKSGQSPAAGGLGGGCVRVELLRMVRRAAVSYERRDRALLTPAFRSWVDAGSPWPLDEDGQLAVVYDGLGSATQCLLWHTAVEREDPTLVSRITGVPAQSVKRGGADALRELRAARAELYLIRLDREECRRFITGVRAGASLSSDGLAHLASCPECRAVYAHVRRLDALVATQLPGRLLGWWSAEDYLRTKETARLPLVDPPFLHRALNQGRGGIAAGSAPSNRARDPNAVHAGHAQLSRQQRLGVALTVAVMLVVVAVLVAAFAREVRGDRGRSPSPRPRATGPRATVVVPALAASSTANCPLDAPADQGVDAPVGLPTHFPY